jgi:hypothetical protein
MELKMYTISTRHGFADVDIIRMRFTCVYKISENILSAPHMRVLDVHSDYRIYQNHEIRLP